MLCRCAFAPSCCKIQSSSKTLIPIFQGYKEYLFDVTTMIYCFFIQNYQRCNTHTTPLIFADSFVFAECCHFYSSPSMIYCPHSNILSIVDVINIKGTSHPKREVSKYLLFGSLFGLSSRTIFVCSFDHRKVIIRL